MHIAAVDAHSDQPADLRLFEGFVAAQAASMESLHDGTSGAWSVDELREMRRSRTDFGYADRAALVDGAVVGMLAVAMPQHDNRDKAMVMLHVRPEHRRHGIGEALMAEAEAIARADDRSVLMASTDCDAGRDDVGEAFAHRHGFALAQTMLASHLDLPAERDTMRLMAAGDRAAPYEMDVAWDRLPAHWLADRAVLSARMSTDAPQGDLSWDEETWTCERVVEDAVRVVRSGRRLLEVVARDTGTGRLVGFTRISVPIAEPEVGYQQDTLVLREARGHGLGLRMKATAVLELLDRMPGTRKVLTWNADDNTAMLAVNRKLGCTVDGIQREWERTLTPISAPDAT